MMRNENYPLTEHFRATINKLDATYAYRVRMQSRMNTKQFKDQTYLNKHQATFLSYQDAQNRVFDLLQIAMDLEAAIVAYEGGSHFAVKVR